MTQVLQGQIILPIDVQTYDNEPLPRAASHCVTGVLFLVEKCETNGQTNAHFT